MRSYRLSQVAGTLRYPIARARRRARTSHPVAKATAPAGTRSMPRATSATADEGTATTDTSSSAGPQVLEDVVLSNSRREVFEVADTVSWAFVQPMLLRELCPVVSNDRMST